MPIPEGPPTSCFYLDGFIAVEQNQGMAAQEALGGYDVEVEVVPPSAVLGDSEAVGVLDRELDILSTTVDSFDVATLLQELRVTAGPIYAVGLAGHWRLALGTDPISRPAAALPDPTSDLGEGIIAVVDSGIVEDPGGPDWMSRGEHVLYDDMDIETITNDPRVASHGTFVTSIIRQLAPEYRVAFASALPVSPGDLAEREDALPPALQYVTTELHVAEAITRLTQRSELTAENVTALNLSLGTYPCAPGKDPTLVATMAAMRIWFNAFPESTVFAAGGNEPYDAPFWPAALSTYPLDPNIQPDWVRGVGAVNEDQEQVVWGSSTAAATTSPMRAPPRPWVTNVAPGCDLLGLRGGKDADGATVVAWSGSSFASAVSAALVTSGVAPVAPGPPHEYDYSAPGLSFENLGSCDIP
ncbi:MAG: S8 family serine peptidase [Acidimicrobiia bacterium]